MAIMIVVEFTHKCSLVKLAKDQFRKRSTSFSVGLCMWFGRIKARLHRAILSRDKSCDKIAAKLH